MFLNIIPDVGDYDFSICPSPAPPYYRSGTSALTGWCVVAQTQPDTLTFARTLWKTVSTISKNWDFHFQGHYAKVKQC